MPNYTPQLSGSSILWVSQSTNAEWITTYTSSNPTLVAAGKHTGSFTGGSLHLTYIDMTQSGSHSIWGVWTGSEEYHTESGANSHGIPANSQSIFTSSYGQSSSAYPTEHLGLLSESIVMKITLEDDGSLLIANSQSGADTSGFYFSSSGAVGIGTTSPTTNFDVKTTSNLATLASPAFTGRPSFTDALFTDMTATSITASHGMKGNVNGTATNATNATNVTTATDSGNATHYITFVDSASGTQQLKTDAGITYNPSTNVLGATVGSAVTATCAATVAVNAGGDEEGAVGPILYSSDRTPDGGCETVFGCQDVEVDCTKKGIWINGGLITHDRGTFTFQYGDSTTTIRVGK